MDIQLSEDQRLLQDTARRFLGAEASVSDLRKLVKNAVGFDKSVWQKGAGLGWLAFFVPEAHGGMQEYSQGVIDAAILAEELGRVVFAGPFLPSSVTAFAIATAGSPAQAEAWLPGLADGSVVGTWCLAGAASNGIAPADLTLSRAGSDYELNGVASYVFHGDEADLFLASAISSGGLSQALVPKDAAGVSIVTLETLDLGRRLAQVHFDRTPVAADQLLGEAGQAAAQIERQLQVAVALQCAETLGVVDRTLEFTLDYAKQRMAFGRPIGGFQALKHRFADHAQRLEAGRAATAYAAQAVEHQAPDAAIAVSAAKSHVGRWGTEIIRDCLQIHGGIGMTYDHDIHFYLRRAVSNEALLGTPAVHHERLCQLAGL